MLFFNLFPAFPVLSKQPGKEAESGTCDRSDMADPENEVPVPDRLNLPDLFEFTQKETCCDQPDET